MLCVPADGSASVPRFLHRHALLLHLRNHSFAAALIVAALSLALPAGAAVIPATGADGARRSGTSTCTKYAAPWGRNSNRGTVLRPYRSVQYLVNKLTRGQVGCLKRGTYVGDVSFYRGDVTLRSVIGVRARIRGYLRITDEANHVTVSRIVIDGHDAGPITLHVYGDDAVLTRLEVTNRHKLNGTYRGSCILLGHVTMPTFRPLISRSRIHACGGGNGGHDHGIYAEFSRGAVIRNNYIYDNPGYGISMYPSAQNSLIAHNVIDGNGRENRGNLTFSGEEAGGEYAQSFASSNNRVQWNIITNAQARYNVESYFPERQPVGNVVEHNCVWRAPWGNFGYTDGYARRLNRSVNPLFVARGARTSPFVRGARAHEWAR